MQLVLKLYVCVPFPQNFQNFSASLRPGGLLSAELAHACREWTVSSIHGCDLITRLSGPCLLKLRRDLVAGPFPIRFPPQNYAAPQPRL